MWSTPLQMPMDVNSFLVDSGEPPKFFLKEVGGLLHSCFRIIILVAVCEFIFLNRLFLEQF